VLHFELLGSTQTEPFVSDTDVVERSPTGEGLRPYHHYPNIRAIDNVFMPIREKSILKANEAGGVSFRR
jgi:hypothetical protein